MIGQYTYVFARVAAMISLAPIFGSQTVPVKVKIIIAIVITYSCVNFIKHDELIDPLSFHGLLILSQEVLIGLLIGFAFSLVFDALITGGQIVAQLMGLGFASMMDPQNGVSVPVIGQFYTVIAALIFLSLNGHLLLVEMVVHSFNSIPIGGEISRDLFLNLALWSKWLFIGAIMVALPSIVALLVVNIAFGVMTRSAPQLNIFAVGFPITILFGFVVMILTLPNFLDKFYELINELVLFITNI